MLTYNNVAKLLQQTGFGAHRRAESLPLRPVQG